MVGVERALESEETGEMEGERTTILSGRSFGEGWGGDLGSKWGTSDVVSWGSKSRSLRGSGRGAKRMRRVEGAEEGRWRSRQEPDAEEEEEEEERSDWSAGSGVEAGDGEGDGERRRIEVVIGWDITKQRRVLKKSATRHTLSSVLFFYSDYKHSLGSLGLCAVADLRSI